jgi:hypothetical protein
VISDPIFFYRCSRGELVVQQTSEKIPAANAVRVPWQRVIDEGTEKSVEILIGFQENVDTPITCSILSSKANVILGEALHRSTLNFIQQDD